MPNIEEDVPKLADKEGWIQIHEYMKFAMPTELCKVEFVDRVFQKGGGDDEKKKSEAKKEKVRVMFLTFLIFLRLVFLCPYHKPVVPDLF